MHFDRDFRNPIFVSDTEILKPKPLSAYSFRKLHRVLVEFHDTELQQECCRLADKKSVGDSVCFGYCCVDEQAGLQFHVLVALNRDGSSDYLVSVPEGKEIVLSYSEAKEKIICLTWGYPNVPKNSVERCRHIMEQHEHNPTIMCKDLDSFRDTEFPLDVQLKITNDEGATEKIRFRPMRKISYNMFEGIVLSESQNSTLHKGDTVTAKIIYGERKRAVDLIQYIPVSWSAVNQGDTLGEIGPNDGIVIEDEAYADYCRVTMEDCIRCFAVSCMINENMKHTVFCKKEVAYNIYEDIKNQFQLFFDGYELHELNDFWNDFVSDY